MSQSQLTLLPNNANETTSQNVRFEVDAKHWPALGAVRGGFFRRSDLSGFQALLCEFFGKFGQPTFCITYTEEGMGGTHIWGDENTDCAFDKYLKNRAGDIQIDVFGVRLNFYPECMGGLYIEAADTKDATSVYMTQAFADFIAAKCQAQALSKAA